MKKNPEGPQNKVVSSGQPAEYSILLNTHSDSIQISSITNTSDSYILFWASTNLSSEMYLVPS